MAARIFEQAGQTRLQYRSGVLGSDVYCTRYESIVVARLCSGPPIDCLAYLFISPFTSTPPCTQDIFVSRSTFSLSLVKSLASRALKLPLASVSRVCWPGEQSTYYCMKKWLHEYKELVGNVSPIGLGAMFAVGRAPKVYQVSRSKSSFCPQHPKTNDFDRVLAKLRHIWPLLVENPKIFWSKIGYMLKISTNHTPGALLLARLTSYLSLARKGQGIPGFVYSV